MSIDYDSITRGFSESSETAATDDNNTTSTLLSLPTCEAKPDGVACWHHAEKLYTTSEDITKNLCLQHYNRLWQIDLAWYEVRAQTAEVAS